MSAPGEPVDGASGADRDQAQEARAQNTEEKSPAQQASDEYVKQATAQMRELVDLYKQLPQGLSLSPPLGEFIISSILQLLALGIAIAFGVYAVKSVRVANEANNYAVEALVEARLANQIAMLSICAAVNENSESVPEFCKQPGPIEPAAFSSQATQFLFSETTSLAATASSTALTTSTRGPNSGSVTLTSSRPTSTSSTSFTTASGSPSGSHDSGSSGASVGTIVGATVGSIIGTILILSFLCFTAYRRKQSRKPIQNELWPGDADSQIGPVECVPHHGHEAPLPTSVQPGAPGVPGVPGSLGRPESMEVQATQHHAPSVVSLNSYMGGPPSPHEYLEGPPTNWYPPQMGTAYGSVPPMNWHAPQMGMAYGSVPPMNWHAPQMGTAFGSTPPVATVRRRRGGAGEWFREWFLDSRIRGS